MKELSLNILDIAKNSVEGGASVIYITLDMPDDNMLSVTIKDNGRGIPSKLLESITDPFTTTRTTRPVGMGLPLFKMAAEMTGGSFQIDSTVGSGTSVFAIFNTSHIDMPPIGNIWDSIAALISGSPDIDFIYTRNLPDRSYTLDTAKLRETLDGVSLSEPDVILWITEYIKEHELFGI